MKLIDLSKNTSPHFAETASHLVDLSQVVPNCSAKRSTTRNPTLWRVPAYSGPGFPKPAIKRICGVFSSTSAQSKIENPKTCPERSGAKSNGFKMDYFFCSFSFGADAFSFGAPSFAPGPAAAAV